MEKEIKKIINNEIIVCTSALETLKVLPKQERLDVIARIDEFCFIAFNIAKVLNDNILLSDIYLLALKVFGANLLEK